MSNIEIPDFSKITIEEARAAINPLRKRLQALGIWGEFEGRPYRMDGNQVVRDGAQGGKLIFWRTSTSGDHILTICSEGRQCAFQFFSKREPGAYREFLPGVKNSHAERKQISTQSL